MNGHYPTIKYIFDRRNKASKTKAETLYFEIMYRRVRRYLNTGVKLYKHQWNSSTLTVVFHKDAERLNKQLESQRRHLLDLLEQHVNSPTGFNLVEFVEDASRDTKVDKTTFIDFAFDRCYLRGLKPDTLKQHLVALRALDAFGKIKYFRDLTPANILDFDAWLRVEKGIDYQNTIYGYHKRIKVYVNEAIQYGYLNDNPYTKVKIPRGEESKIRYLTQKEVDAIRNTEIEDASLGRIRALFVLQIYTGLSYSDMYSVDWGNVYRRDDGRYYIRQSRVKTNEEYYLVLLPPAVEVLDAFGWILPKISNQKYNAYLKGLGIACGIAKPLTSHVARHTFATTITLSNKVPIEIVAKMMGHSDIKTTQRYARVLADDVIDAFKELEAKL